MIPRSDLDHGSMKITNLFKSKKQKLIEEMLEKQPLPLGVTEFHSWSDRIISKSMISADIESQKFALAMMITHLPATEDHKEDAHFIKTLRKVASNQVAQAMASEIKSLQQERARKAEIEKENKAKEAEKALEQEYIPPTIVEDEQDVLEKQTV